MRITRHGPHLTQLARLRLSNAWLVHEDDGLTLVDTTPAGAASGLQAAARQLGAPIRRVVITHAHNDHYGSLDALHGALPEAEVLMSARDARFMAGDRSFDPGEARGPMPLVFVTKASTRPTRELAEGDRVGSLEVVAAPGHTPGQVALLDVRDRTLLCGDAYLAVGGLFVTTKPVARFPFPALLATWHKPTAYATAERLRALEPTRLATGHGPLVAPAVPAMERALREAPRG